MADYGNKPRRRSQQSPTMATLAFAASTLAAIVSIDKLFCFSLQSKVFGKYIFHFFL